MEWHQFQDPQLEFLTSQSEAVNYLLFSDKQVIQPCGFCSEPDHELTEVKRSFSPGLNWTYTAAYRHTEKISALWKYEVLCAGFFASLFSSNENNLQFGVHRDHSNGKSWASWIQLG